MGRDRSLGTDLLTDLILFGPMFPFVALAWIVDKGISGTRAANVAAAISFCLLVAFIGWSTWAASNA